MLKALASQIDFRLGNEEGSFQPNLRTVVHDTKGGVFRSFEGNQWKAEELADAMVLAARQ